MYTQHYRTPQPRSALLVSLTFTAALMFGYVVGSVAWAVA